MRNLEAGIRNGIEINGRYLFVCPPPRSQRTLRRDVVIARGLDRVRATAVRIRSKYSVPGIAVFKVYAWSDFEYRQHIGWVACYLPGNPCSDMTPGWYWRLNSMQTLHRTKGVRHDGAIQGEELQYMTDALYDLIDAWEGVRS